MSRIDNHSLSSCLRLLTYYFKLKKRYYPWARDAAALPPNHTDYTSLLMVLHDGFLGPAYWENFFTGRKAKRVLLDTHQYFVYTNEQKQAQNMPGPDSPPLNSFL